MVLEIVVAVIAVASLSFGLVMASRSSRRQTWLEKAEAERKSARRQGS